MIEKLTIAFSALFLLIASSTVILGMVLLDVEKKIDAILKRLDKRSDS